MKFDSLFCSLLIFVFIASGCNQRKGNPKLLVFTKTSGFHHSSIPTGAMAIMNLGKQNGFDVDTTSDAAMFTEDTLKKYAAVVFLSNTDNDDLLFDNYQKNAFERYIQAGGGFVGIHAATDAGYHWGWYTRLVGANFTNHPQQQVASINVVDKNDISTKHLPDPWVRKDEWYNFKNLNKDVHVLLNLDEKSYEGGTNGESHPVAWYHDYDGGRAWYTELGHTEESYSEPEYLKHLLGGIKYAMGDNHELNYSKSTTPLLPEENRFTKVTLVQGTFFEPTEMTILPNLDVLVAQRRGEILLYKNETKKVKQVGFLNVYWKTSVPNVNAEEGLLGLQKDPDFKNNHFIYLYYSPADTSVNRLSRFTFKNDTIDLASEKIVLQFYSQRDICCHTGGSIAFGEDRMLFLSTGDNTTPFDEPNQRFVSSGFAPLDDRPGHEQYDEGRSSANTNDLRGKILRIRVNEEGNYSIPANNLFAEGTPKTKPEIYVMGDRNPYRISVDQKNGFLYWGEVGPDAANDSLETRGPQGYDEVNQARKSGFFGWPFFIGNNIPYRAYDYATGISGEPFNADKPINNSRNNTGLQQLPPAQPAFIWYPYGISKDFPQVGSGGRTAMAGPLYHTSLYPKETRLPDYYDGKLFIYEWMRGWIKVVTLQPNGDFDNMEPFMLHTKFANPSDVEVGPDGKLYVLEYGTGWFAKNPDAGLVRIDYNGGNRPPAIQGIKVDKMSGGLPFTITATVEAKDPEHNKLSYLWHIGNGITQKTTEPTLQYTITKAGDYAVSVDVIDNENASSASSAVNVYAGNEAPKVTVKIDGNQTFYFPGRDVKYEVLIEDKGDTSKVKDLNNLMVTADYIQQSEQENAATGHQRINETLGGKNKMLSLDCSSCHNVDDKSIGPAFTLVSHRYQKDPKASDYLAQKIIHGGSGAWGEVPMAAHPDLKENEAKEIVKWILSLDQKIKSLPAKGKLNATLNKPVQDNNVLYISAAYTDKGGPNIKPLMGSNFTVLRNSKVNFEKVSQVNSFKKTTTDGINLMLVPNTEGWIQLKNIDLSGIVRASMNLAWKETPVETLTFEIHVDAADGIKIGELKFEGSPKNSGSKNKYLWTFAMVTTSLKPVNDGKLHSVFIVKKGESKQGDSVGLSSIQFYEQ